MKISTMKKWGILSWGLTIIVSIATAYSAFSGVGDSDIMMQMCALAWGDTGDTGVFTAAYAFKERTENKKKIAVGMVKDLSAEYGIENVAPLVQAIISE